jgi:type IV pilus assembly protein PilV
VSIRTLQTARHRARGFSLVEVLAALVVLEFGMLGIAGLSALTLRSGSGSIVRTQAISLADDLADRIRANRNAHVAYSGAGANKGCVGTGAANCTSADMAATDLFFWGLQVQQALPSGAGTVTVAPGAVAPFTYQIKVSWVEQGGNNQQYILNMQI